MLLRKYCAVSAVILLFAGIWAAYSAAEQPVCRFKAGDIVHTVLDNRKGQVIKAYDHTCAYKVRFSGDVASQKDSWDVEMVPYGMVYLHEMELRK